ncbi:MAG: hypothetical protein AAB439_00500 [Patescibacteria group bacterium]
MASAVEILKSPVVVASAFTVLAGAFYALFIDNPLEAGNETLGFCRTHWQVLPCPYDDR